MNPAGRVWRGIYMYIIKIMFMGSPLSVFKGRGFSITGDTFADFSRRYLAGKVQIYCVELQ